MNFPARVALRSIHCPTAEQAGVVVVLHASARREFVPFLFAEFVGIQNVEISTVLLCFHRALAENALEPGARVGGDGSDAFVRALQQNPVLGDDVQPLVVQVDTVDFVGQEIALPVVFFLSAHAVVPHEPHHRAAVQFLRHHIVPAVHHVHLLVAGDIEETVLVHIHLGELVGGAEQQHRAGLLLFTDIEAGIEAHLAPPHRIPVQVEEETLLTRLRLFEIHIDLAGDGLVAVGAGRDPFGDADGLHPRAGHKTQPELLGEDADVRHILQ